MAIGIYQLQSGTLETISGEHRFISRIKSSPSRSFLHSVPLIQPSPVSLTHASPAGIFEQRPPDCRCMFAASRRELAVSIILLHI